MQIDNQIETLAAYKEQGLNKTLGEIFEENYYRNIFDVQQMMGEGTAFGRQKNNAGNIEALAV